MKLAVFAILAGTLLASAASAQVQLPSPVVGPAPSTATLQSENSRLRASNAALNAEIARLNARVAAQAIQINRISGGGATTC